MLMGRHLRPQPLDRGSPIRQPWVLRLWWCLLREKRVVLLLPPRVESTWADRLEAWKFLGSGVSTLCPYSIHPTLTDHPYSVWEIHSILCWRWTVLFFSSFLLPRDFHPLLRVSTIINWRDKRERAGTDQRQSWRKGWPGQVPGMSQAKSFFYPGASPPRSPRSPLLNPPQTAVRAKSKPVPFIMDLGINEDCS